MNKYVPCNNPSLIGIQMLVVAWNLSHPLLLKTLQADWSEYPLPCLGHRVAIKKPYLPKLLYLFRVLTVRIWELQQQLFHFVWHHQKSKCS